MRSDSIEFGLVQKAAQQRRKAGAIGAVSGRVPVSDEAKPDVMDEAFASFVGPIGDRTRPPVDRTLVKTLAAQLAALDRQREHLAELLRSIEVDSEPSPSAAL